MIFTPELVKKCFGRKCNLSDYQKALLDLGIEKHWKKKVKNIEIPEDVYKALLKDEKEENSNRRYRSIALKLKRDNPSEYLRIKKYIINELIAPDNQKYSSVDDILKEFDKYHAVTSLVIRGTPYEVFLHSVYWRIIRENIIEAHNSKCELCGSADTIFNVHHLNYTNRGDEMHHLDSLCCLCKNCHKRVHGLNGEAPFTLYRDENGILKTISHYRNITKTS